MTNKFKGIIALSAFMACGGIAQAQGIRPGYSFPTTPSSGSQVGPSPFFVSPYVGIAAGHDDNVGLSNTNKMSSALYITSPGLKIDARSPSSLFQMDYQGQIGRYLDSDQDNYIDHTVRAQLDTAFSGRSFLRAAYEYLRTHDPRGSTDRPLSNELDKYKLSKPSLTYAYGAPGAQGRVETYFSDARVTYLTNREVTALGDRKTLEFGGAFYWRVMPKTYLLAEARRTDISYRLPNPASGDEMRYYGGVSWEATAATTGTLKVGRLTRRFNGDIPESTSTSWEGLVTWAPRTYSAFELYTSRQTLESTGVGTFILSSVTGVKWNHAWSSVLSTSVLARVQRDEFQGANRTDEIKSLGFKVGYRMRRWLTLGAEYTHTQRDSTQSNSDYDKNLYFLTATASM